MKKLPIFLMITLGLVLLAGLTAGLTGCGDSGSPSVSSSPTLTSSAGAASPTAASSPSPAAPVSPETSVSTLSSLPSEGTVSPAAPAVFTPFSFTDMDGHEIRIEKPVESVYITGMTPLPAVYYYYRGSTAGLVAIPQDSKDMISQSVFAEIFADLLQVPSDARDSGAEVNVEAILKAKPDVVFITGGYPESYQALVNAGLTVVAFTTAMTADSNAFTNVEQWLDQIATVFGDTRRSEALKAENARTLAGINALTGNLAETEKPSALILFSLSNNALTAAGGGHYSDFWLLNSGARNAAAELNKIQPVNIEQIMLWNPDIIYITNFNSALPDDLYNNTFDGLDWSQVKAVQDRRVYKLPLGSYRWYAPSLEGSLLLKWLAVTNQPQLAADLDIQTEFKQFFETFYNWELSDAQYNLMLHTAE